MKENRKFGEKSINFRISYSPIKIDIYKPLIQKNGEEKMNPNTHENSFDLFSLPQVNFTKELSTIKHCKLDN